MSEKILTYYNEALALINDKICKPRMVILYPVYGCNLSCPGCLCGDYNREKIFMNMERLKDLTQDLKENGIRSIELCGGGEPLLHPQIKSIITWITNKLHISLGIMTNGTRLEDELNYLIVTKSCYIRVSLYNQTFDHVKKKLVRLIQMRNLYGSNLKIGTKLLVSSQNYNDILDQCKRLIEIGPDLISLKAERNSPYEITDERLPILEQSIKELGSPIIEASLKKTSIEGKCWLSPIHTLIDPNGDMYICCYYMGREKEHLIGNIFEKDFTEIWGSEQHRNKLKNVNPDMCNVYDCRWHKYNNLMRQLFESNYVQQEFC